MTVFSIGTRGSPLALAQACLTAQGLVQATGLSPAHFPQSIIQTSGDMIQDRALSEAGGKGLFTKEIDEAQLRGEIAIAVHSGKDLPTRLPEGLMLAGFLPRADVRDAFISTDGMVLSDMPASAKIGTASLRRKAQLLQLRPDLQVELIRGNVQTRINKVRSGEYAGTLLALAGLERLGLAHEAAEILDIDRFLPAVAQGAIALVTRVGDADTLKLVAQINHLPTQQAVEAERAFLHELDGSCRTPIAGHATVAGDELSLRVCVMSNDGKRAIHDTWTGHVDKSVEACSQLGKSIRARLPNGFFDLVT
jgi:hydroxymethylbilane synthase